MNLQLKEFGVPRWLVIGGAIIVVVGTLIWQMPVKWFQGTISAATKCKVLLTDPSGTLWSGGAAIGFSEPGLDGQSCRPPQAITERLYWSTACSLQKRNCTVRIETAALDNTLFATIGMDGVMVQENEAQLPAEILEMLGAPWTILHPRGDLTARWSDLHFSRTGNSGNIRANLDALSSPVSLIRPLGNYSVQASLTGGGVSYSLTTTEGPLLLSAQGSIGADGKASGRGEASATPETQEALNGLLSLIGRRQGDTYILVF